MNRRNKKSLCLLAVVITILSILSGCWDERTFEDIGFFLIAGMEHNGSNSAYKITYVIPVIDPSTQGESEVYVGEGNDVREAREMAAFASPRRLEPGKVQHLLISKDLAEKGIHEFLEVFLRNTEASLLANITIVDGSPHELIMKAIEFKDKPRVSFYMTYLIQAARDRGYSPETRTFRFDIDYHSETIDPIAPIVKLGETELIVVGTALFSRDKMVGQIDTIKSGLLLAMMNKGRSMHYFIKDYEIDDLFEEYNRYHEDDLVLLINGKKNKVNIRIEDAMPVIDIHLNFDARVIIKHLPLDLDNEESQRRLEKLIEKKLTADCMELIQYLQKVGSDPLGIQELVRVRHNDYWKSIDWMETYCKSSINVFVNVNITNYGNKF